jgi:hypothetical protein
MSGNTQEYYEIRSRKEWELAAAALDPKIAAIHVEMAEYYDALIAKEKARPKLSVVTSNPDPRFPSISPSLAVFRLPAS